MMVKCKGILVGNRIHLLAGSSSEKSRLCAYTYTKCLWGSSIYQGQKLLTAASQCCQSNRPGRKRWLRGRPRPGEMAQGLRVLRGLAEDLSSVLITHAQKLLSVYNSSSWESDTLFWLPVHTWEPSLQEKWLVKIKTTEQESLELFSYL